MQRLKKIPFLSISIFFVMLLIGYFVSSMFPVLSILFYLVPLIIIFMYVFVLNEKDPLWLGLDLEKIFNTTIVIGFIFAFLLVLLHVSILLFSNTGYLVQTSFSEDFSSILAIILSGIIVQVLVSLFEETIFRGFMFSEIQDKMGTFNGIVLSSILFAFSHIYAAYRFSAIMNFNLVIFLFNMFLGGVLLSILRLKGKSLYGAMAFHFSWNFFGYHIFGLLSSQHSVLVMQYIGDVGLVAFEVSPLGTLVFSIGIILCIFSKNIR